MNGLRSGREGVGEPTRTRLDRRRIGASGAVLRAEHRGALEETAHHALAIRRKRDAAALLGQGAPAVAESLQSAARIVRGRTNIPT